jgi:4-aminobutyrate aminotransferase
VRGKGLFVGLELVSNRKTKKPAGLETSKVVYRAWQLGLLTVFVGTESNVIELTPALTITEEELDAGIDILDQAIGDVENGLVPDSLVSDYTGI